MNRFLKSIMVILLTLNLLSFYSVSQDHDQNLASQGEDSISYDLPHEH